MTTQEILGTRKPLSKEERYNKFHHPHTKFRKSWAWNKDETKFFERISVGFTLHVCSGESKVGDVTVDLFEKASVKADLKHLPFKKYSFDTVICDPPWKYYNKFRWILHLKDLARRRLVLVTPNIAPNLKGMKESFVIARRNLINFKVIVIYDRVDRFISTLMRSRNYEVRLTH